MAWATHGSLHFRVDCFSHTDRGSRSTSTLVWNYRRATGYDAGPPMRAAPDVDRNLAVVCARRPCTLLIGCQRDLSAAVAWFGQRHGPSSP